jgi:hypothetical protein
MTIKEICKKYKIEKYTINVDGTVDVDGSVRLDNLGLTELPLRFGSVTGDFDCEYNRLTTLEGCPKEIGFNFCCFDNDLTSFKGGPVKVGGYVDAGYNDIDSLDYAPLEVGDVFHMDMGDSVYMIENYSETIKLYNRNKIIKKVLG